MTRFLTRNPDVQLKLHDVVLEHFGSSEEITYDKLVSLPPCTDLVNSLCPYDSTLMVWARTLDLESVVHETLRLSGTVPTLQRQGECDSGSVNLSSPCPDDLRCTSSCPRH